MEYTNDTIFKVQYRKKQNKSIVQKKDNILKQQIEKIKNNGYFVLTIMIGGIALFIDYLIIKQFIEIINLL